jgi:hypothetical protein
MMYRSRDCKAIVANRAARVPPWRVFLWSFPVLALLLMLAQALPSHAQGTAAAPSATRTGADQGPADYSLRFDAARDPAGDLRARACGGCGQRQPPRAGHGRRGLVRVVLPARSPFPRSDPKRRARCSTSGFEVLRVYYGDDNPTRPSSTHSPTSRCSPLLRGGDRRPRARIGRCRRADRRREIPDTGLIRKFAAAWHRH